MKRAKLQITGIILDNAILISIR